MNIKTQWDTFLGMTNIFKELIARIVFPDIYNNNMGGDMLDGAVGFMTSLSLFTKQQQFRTSEKWQVYWHSFNLSPKHFQERH